MAADADLPQQKLRTRLRRVQTERTKLEEQLERTDDRLDAGAAMLNAAVELLQDPEELYRCSSDKYRRLLNQSIFERVYVYETEVAQPRLREPFAELHEAQTQLAGEAAYTIGYTKPTELAAGQTGADLLVTALLGKGSSKTAMVDVRELVSNPAIGRYIGVLHRSIGAPPVGRATPVPPIRQRRLNSAEVDRLVDAYHAGARVEDLAERFGVFRSTAYAHLRRRHVQLRARGRLSPAQISELVQAYRSGATSWELAERYGVGVDSVLRRLRANGVVLRRRGPRARRNPA